MFLDETASIGRNEPRLGYGVAVTDVDGDGAFEFVVAGYGCANLVLKWEGRRLVDIADAVMADARRNAIGLCAADADGDGREELYILNSESFSGPKQFGDRLFACFGHRWLDLFGQPENFAAINQTAGRSVACIDRAGTGKYGFVVANHGGRFRLYEFDRRGRVSDVAEEAGIDLPASGRALVSLPLVSDRMDIFAANEHGPNFLFRNTGDGTFEEIAAEWGIADRGLATGAASPFWMPTATGCSTSSTAIGKGRTGCSFRRRAADSPMRRRRKWRNRRESAPSSPPISTMTGSRKSSSTISGSRTGCSHGRTSAGPRWKSAMRRSLMGWAPGRRWPISTATAGWNC